MSYRRVRRDENHAPIQHALERCGWLVLDCAAIGGGVADLLAYHPAREVWTWVEIKRPGVAGKKRGRRQAVVNDNQAAFRRLWPTVVIEDVEQVARL